MLLTGIILIGIAVVCVVLACNTHELTQIAALILCVACLTFGLVCIFGSAGRQTANLTIHFLDTDTYVTYENAYSYRTGGNQYVVTEDGNKIQVVNAEIISETGG
jgi:hypothetical protein